RSTTGRSRKVTRCNCDCLPRRSLNQRLGTLDQDSRMANPKKVLYFAENALSAIQGGGIVAHAVLKGLPAENLLGFYEYRNITPVPEYADRFTYLGNWRTPKSFHLLNRATGQRTVALLHRCFTERF